MVHLSRIYTKSGDSGETWLNHKERVEKSDPLIALIGDIDEANAFLGNARMYMTPGDIKSLLLEIQQELFELGADIVTRSSGDIGVTATPLRISEKDIARLEANIDKYNEVLPPLNSFIIPSNHLHLARAIVRRAERSAWNANDIRIETAAKYLNRLSDLLFVLARVCDLTPEILWKPREQ